MLHAFRQLLNSRHKTSGRCGRKISIPPSTSHSRPQSSLVGLRSRKCRRAAMVRHTHVIHFVDFIWFMFTRLCTRSAAVATPAKKKPSDSVCVCDELMKHDEAS